jgi:hypothetical protein
MVVEVIIVMIIMIITNICKDPARSILRLRKINISGLWVTHFTWVGYQSVANPHIFKDQSFYSGFLSLKTDCLQWITSSVWPPRNSGKRPLPGATHRTSGTWSSHKPGSPLPVVPLSHMTVAIANSMALEVNCSSKRIYKIFSLRKNFIGDLQ